ncbi:MAG TPA: NUDIX domain-containing protein, partial [Candidatus Deferrimicrobiaceae bacterium]
MTKKAPETGKRSGLDLIVRPYCLVDVVIFTILDDRLQVLLVQRPDRPDDPFPSAWALPGGFIHVERDATLEDAARRKLLEKTGIASGYLEQLGSFGSRDRDPRGWSVTTVYFALISSEGVVLEAGGNAGEAA